MNPTATNPDATVPGLMAVGEAGCASVHGANRLGRAEVEAVVARLAAMTVAERRALAGMEEKRADVIVAGGCIVLGVLEASGAEAVLVSDRGVRDVWGTARDGIAEMMEIERSGGDPAVVFKERSFAEAEREIEEWTERNCA